MKNTQTTKHHQKPQGWQTVSNLSLWGTVTPLKSRAIIWNTCSDFLKKRRKDIWIIFHLHHHDRLLLKMTLDNSWLVLPQFSPGQQTWSEPPNFTLPWQCWPTPFLCPAAVLRTQLLAMIFIPSSSLKELKTKDYYKSCQQRILTTLRPWCWSTTNTYTGYYIRLQFPSSFWKCWLKTIPPLLLPQRCACPQPSPLIRTRELRQL